MKIRTKMKKLLILALLVVGCDYVFFSNTGCMDQNACNYDYSAEYDSRSCIYPCEITDTTSVEGGCYLECCDGGDGEGNYPIMDCNGICDGAGVVNTDGDGNCCASGSIDCEYTCGGTAVRDECSICNGGGIEDGDTLINIIDITTSTMHSDTLYLGSLKTEGTCFNKNDLSVINELIDNNITDTTFMYLDGGFDSNNDNIFDPWEFGIQEWFDSRLHGLLLGIWGYGGYLEGTIPNSISDLDSLHYLSLNNNNFIGSVPESISNLTALISLDLRNNRLTSLPSTICDLPSDCTIKVSGNCLSEEYHYDCIDEWGEQNGCDNP